VHTDYQALPRVNTRLRGIAGWGLNNVTEVTLKFWILLEEDAHAVAGHCMVLRDYNQRGSGCIGMTVHAQHGTAKLHL
jgi:hypothetical protein